jgi:hypothetical protein
VASIEFDLQSAVSASVRVCVSSLTDAGVVLTTAITLFTARIVCEQTLLTWRRGGHMMEFSPPQFGLDLIGMLCVILGILWALAVVGLSLTKRGNHRWEPRPRPAKLMPHDC